MAAAGTGDDGGRQAASSWLAAVVDGGLLAEIALDQKVFFCASCGVRISRFGRHHLRFLVTPLTQAP